MSSSNEFAEFVVGQMEQAGSIRTRKMFGEFGVYCDDKFVALICDDSLYVKHTDGGLAFIKKPTYGPPYPGAKEHFLIQDELEDPDWLGQLIRITYEQLPVPKPKKPRKKATKKGL